MHRLPIYIFRNFADAILGVVALALALGWLTQVLRYFALVTGKGQSLLVLVGQTGLLFPDIVAVVLPACVIIGMARTLRSFEASRELHAIHGAGRIGALMAAGAAVAVIVSLVTAATVHFVKPATTVALERQSRAINADLIASTSTEGRFIEIEKGITLRIDRRNASGAMEGFFLHDDRDPEVEQTIYAASANVTRLEEGIDVELRNGSLQFLDRASGLLSAVRFERYQLGITELVTPSATFLTPRFRSTPELIADLADDPGDGPRRADLHTRLAAPLYVLSFAALTMFVMGFPGGQSVRRRVPPEIWLVAVAVAVQTAGSAAGQIAAQSGVALPLIYLAPLLPLVPALILAWRRLGWSHQAGRLRRWASR
jgi:lipopolysaccharide export system permease protein